MSSRSPHVIVSTQAQEDFEDILVHSARSWGSEQADAYEEAIDSALQTLSSFPMMGRPRNDLFVGCRSYPVEQHVIYYELEAETLTILRMLHEKMDAALYVRR